MRADAGRCGQYSVGTQRDRNGKVMRRTGNERKSDGTSKVDLGDGMTIQRTIPPAGGK